MVEGRSQKYIGNLSLSRRDVVIGGMLAGTAALAAARLPKERYPVIPSEEFVDWVPKAFGRWNLIDSSGVVLPPPDSLSDRLYDNLVTRAYRNDGGDEIMLLLAYNNRQDGMLQVHRPEVCYPVGGFELTDTRPAQMEMGGAQVPSSLFSAVSPRRIEHVHYFTRVGRSFPRTWAQQRAEVIKANLAGYIPDGLMYRASSLAREADKGFDLIAGFVPAFFQAAATPLQQLFVGEN